MATKDPAPAARTRLVGVLPIAALAVGAVLIVALAFLPPTNEISVLHQTISEYGLSANKWIFNLGVLLVAAGSVAGFGALWHQRRLPTASVVLGALWVIGLLVIVAFPKHDFAAGPHTGFGGTLHRMASVVAFGCLPFAVLCAARAAFPRSPTGRLVARLLAVVALAWLGVILVAVLIAAGSGGRWWELIPLGLVERGMALSGLLALAALFAGIPTPTATRRPQVRAATG